MAGRAGTFDLPGVRVTLGTPRQVTEGVGFCWFPSLAKFPSGELLLTHGLVADAEGNLLTGQAVFISSDDGETWDTSYQTANGANIKIIRSDGTIAGPTFHLFPDPPGQWRNFKGHYVRYEAAGQRYVLDPWAVRVEGLPRDVKPSQHEGQWSRQWMARIYFDGDAVEVDGRIITTAYVTYQGEEHYGVVALASEDEGRTWHYLSTVAGPEVAPESREGPDEASMVQLADGDLMCVIRVGSGTDQLLARAYSSDGGKSWSEVDRIPAFSVEPSLRRLENGVLTLSTGRPGIYLWLSTDPRGDSWESVDVIAHHNSVLEESHHIHPRIEGISPPDTPDQTTAYTELVEVSSNRLLLVYDRIPFSWKGVPIDSEERSRIYVLPIEVQRA